MVKLRDLDKALALLPTYDVPLTIFELGVLVYAFTASGFKIPERIEKVLDEVVPC